MYDTVIHLTPYGELMRDRPKDFKVPSNRGKLPEDYGRPKAGDRVLWLGDEYVVSETRVFMRSGGRIVGLHYDLEDVETGKLVTCRDGNELTDISPRWSWV